MTNLIMSALISLFLSLIARGYQAASSRDTWTGCQVDRPARVRKRHRNVKFWTLSLGGLLAHAVARIVLGGSASKWVWEAVVQAWG
jgi:hypothetical protein